MKILIVGLGAIGGTVATRGISAGMQISLATRSKASADLLRASGLKVSGIGGSAEAHSLQIAPLEAYFPSEKFDLILLATKAHEALEIAPFLAKMLNADGTLLPIQNGGVSQLLAEKLGGDIVLGGISNLGATMVSSGIYEQRNAGGFLIGELKGGISERAQNVGDALRSAIGIQVTPNMNGVVWSKLLLNCSITTLGAVAGQSMRQYLGTSAGKEIFRKVYEETLAIALKSGAKPEKLVVEPIPGADYENWLNQVLNFYGDLKASMLQDFERGRKTEIDFINGYVAQVGKQLGVPAPLNLAITEVVHQIENGEKQSQPQRLEELLVGIF